MTTTRPDVDTARAQDLDEAHVAWCMAPATEAMGPATVVRGRRTFGAYAIDFLRERGLAVAVDGDRPEAVSLLQRDDSSDEPAPPTGMQLANLLALLDGRNPFLEQAVAMSVEEVADLLAALAERDLHWDTGEDDECGTLAEGQAEPPDLHVVFDADRAAWQRHDERAGDHPDPHWRWFGPLDLRRTWADLQRTVGPLSPDGGIAPTTPGRTT